MSPARRNELRTIFCRAWNVKSADGPRSFADCLETAWAEHKGREAYFAKVAAPPGRQLRRLTLRSPIESPVERAVRHSGTPYVYAEARARSYLTSKLSR